MYGDKGFAPKAAPVNVGDEMEVTVEAVGKKGDGIVKKEGFVLFVNGVRKGDHVKVRVTKVLRNVGFAEVVGKVPGGEPSEGSEESDEESDEESSGEESEDADSEDSEEETEEEAVDTEDFGEEEK